MAVWDLIQFATLQINAIAAALELRSGDEAGDEADGEEEVNLGWEYNTLKLSVSKPSKFESVEIWNWQNLKLSTRQADRPFFDSFKVLVYLKTLNFLIKVPVCNFF